MPSYVSTEVLKDFKNRLNVHAAMLERSGEEKAARHLTKVQHQVSSMITTANIAAVRQRQELEKANMREAVKVRAATRAIMKNLPLDEPERSHAIEGVYMLLDYVGIDRSHLDDIWPGDIM